ncbi:hypothetical protein [Saliniramus sp.]|uniref:hypothetical protein n=1 Tax=Saliniramus sp. TaxID=2986772 RepID=UPI002C9B82FD|nr:hypothetical protein [Saliniramus sp.]HMB12126.1 hypothetical protein [Saliniramus sp.]
MISNSNCSAIVLILHKNTRQCAISQLGGVVASVLGRRVDRHLTKLPAATLLAVVGASKQAPSMPLAGAYNNTPAMLFQFTKNLLNLFLRVPTTWHEYTSQNYFVN